MQTELSDRMARLAERAPAALGASGGADPATVLWRRGRRRQARGLLGAALAVAVVAAGLGVGSQRLLAATEAPVAERPARTAGTVVPDRLRDPSPWAGTSEDAAGPLLMIGGAERRTWWGGTRNGLVGVSAVDGMPRLLDLPGYDLPGELGGDPAALSSDGRLLAWWTVPDPGPGGTGGPGEPGEPVDGLRVLDTVTGEQWHRELPGARLGQVGEGLAWAGEVLWAQYFTVTELGSSTSSSEYADTLRWDLGTGRVRDGLPARAAPSLDGVRSGPAGFLASRNNGYAVVVGDRVTGQVRLTGARDLQELTLSAGATRVAGLRTRDAGDPGLVVGTLARGGTPGDRGRVRMREVARVPADQVLGWADERRVVVTTWQDGAADLATVDVGTGELRRVSRFDRGSWAPTPTVASGLVTGDRVVVDDPARVPDPRWVALAVAVLLGLGVWFRRWRRGRA